MTEIHSTVPEKFEARVNHDPNKWAVISNGNSLTYARLNARANQIARHLLSIENIDFKKPIALYLEHGAPIIMAMLGALKAGAFYIPLEPTFPVARNAKIIAHAGVQLILTSNPFISDVQEICKEDQQFLNIDNFPQDLDRSNLINKISVESNCQILYTSGSTGTPKGVLHSHLSVTKNAKNQGAYYAIDTDDRMLLLASCHTAQASGIIFSALLNGATIYPWNLRKKGFTGFSQLLKENAITFWWSSASIFRRFFDHLVEQTDQFPAMRQVKLGSEPVYMSDVDLFRARFSPDCRLLNALSSTEGGLQCIQEVDTSLNYGNQSIPVGRAVDGKEVEILNDEGMPVNAGEIGQIVLRSNFLAKGYWNDVELTELRFRRDPAGSGAMFFTGDLGRIKSDGTLQHLGRIDNQVKINGNRIEIGEVELNIRAHPKIEDVAVIASDDRSYLTAFVVRDQTETFNKSGLRDFLSKTLPGYLIPREFIKLAALPLTPSGKVDRHALRNSPVNPGGDHPFIAAKNTVEIKLSEIWSKHLWHDQISIDQRFIDLGGQSLDAMLIITETEKEFGRRIDLAAFPNMTIAELAASLDGQNGLNKPDVPAMEIAPLSYGVHYKLKAYLAGWRGQRLRPDSIIAGLNTRGSRPPLFWCFQGFHEFEQLAAYLGPDYPVYGMRSAYHILEEYTPENLQSFAASYVKEILEINPDGNYLIGGNCQSAKIAMEISQQLIRHGHAIARLFQMEKYVPRSFPYPVTLLFGRESTFNPVNKGTMTQERELWEAHYHGGYLFRNIPGGHNEFFQEPNIQGLAFAITTSILESIPA